MLTLLQGGGIIGCTTAYFLTRHPAFNPALHKVTVLEATAIAAGASGKAGGLLALWAYPSCLVPLSYRLHAELAAEHNGAERWGYRKVGCGSISAIVKAEDLKNRPRRAGGTAPGADASAAISNGDKNGGGAGETLNGSGNALPIQSTDADSPQRNYAPFADEAQAQVDKEWEKLPKQDSHAASLLADSSLPTDLDWIDRSLVYDYSEMGLGRISNPETAQVHPYHFTTAMAQLARERGVDFLLRAKVTRINHSKTSVTSVEYEERDTGAQKVLEGVTDVVVTAGPWTGMLLPKTKVEGLRAHSVVYDADVSPYAVFTDIALPSDWVPEHRAVKGQRRKHKGSVDPEIYARPFGEVYACGMFLSRPFYGLAAPCIDLTHDPAGEPDTTIPLPETADQVQTDEAQCDDLAAYVATVSPVLAAAPIRTKQACYLPRHMRFGEERGPLVGRTAVPGLWVAAGHTCWGIQNGPATGCLMAEMLLEGEAKSSDIDSLDPRKFKV